MKGIADSLRRRGHPCDKKKLAMLRFIFVFRNFLRMQAFCEVSENKKSEAMLHSFSLRRERDSNPRYSKEYNGFRDRPIRPLWHLSKVI